MCTRWKHRTPLFVFVTVQCSCPCPCPCRVVDGMNVSQRTGSFPLLVLATVGHCVVHTHQTKGSLNHLYSLRVQQERRRRETPKRVASPFVITVWQPLWHFSTDGSVSVRQRNVLGLDNGYAKKRCCLCFQTLS